MIETKLDSRRLLVNDITEYLNKYLYTSRPGTNSTFYKVYIYEVPLERVNDICWIFRVPGCSVGNILLDKETHTITDIVFADDVDYFIDSVKDDIKQFIGKKMIIRR